MTVGPGTKVVIPEPTFTLYALLTTILGGEPVRVPMTMAGEASDRRADVAERIRQHGRSPALRYDVDALLAARRASGAPGHDRLLAEQPHGDQPRAWTTSSGSAGTATASW